MLIIVSFLIVTYLILFNTLTTQFCLFYFEERFDKDYNNFFLLLLNVLLFELLLAPNKYICFSFFEGNLFQEKKIKVIDQLYKKVFFFCFVGILSWSL